MLAPSRVYSNAHMRKDTQINIRINGDDAKAIAALRHCHTKGAKIPTASDIVRRAVALMYERDVKATGHKRLNGK